MSARLLFFCPCTPDPRGTGWEQRAYSFIVGYARFMEVDVWFMPTADRPDLSRLTPLVSVARSVVAFYPYLIEHPQLGFKHRLIASLKAADVVHVSRLPQMVMGIVHKRLIWDIDELPWRENADTPTHPPPPSVEPPPAPPKDVYERCAQNCKVVMASSPLERFEQANEFAVVPNIVSVPAGQAVEESPGTGAHLLFVGNLNFLPNLDALGYFQAAILPKLVERVPDIRVLVVGRSPSTPGAKAAVDRLRQSTHFTFAFDVPDCGDSYRRCTLSITPIRLGGGTRIKILEAFAHGCPVVSTRKGCEGLDVEDGVHLFMADDADQFAAGCLELLRNSERREKLSTHADTFVRGQHTQSVVDRILSSTVADLLSS